MHSYFRFKVFLHDFRYALIESWMVVYLKAALSRTDTFPGIVGFAMGPQIRNCIPTEASTERRRRTRPPPGSEGKKCTVHMDPAFFSNHALSMTRSLHESTQLYSLFYRPHEGGYLRPIFHSCRPFVSIAFFLPTSNIQLPSILASAKTSKSLSRSRRYGTARYPEERRVEDRWHSQFLDRARCRGWT